jgi:hypothetical protein
MFLGSKNTSWSLLMISVSRSYKAFAKILSVAFNKVIEFSISPKPVRLNKNLGKSTLAFHEE